ncbi:MAG: HEAT repeat domain-containing protein [Proteobacteria bacterium]|jgi:hypothetical protein|nr:HEAT repeat domain-containing protein [Pseudomonadota bacterium]
MSSVKFKLVIEIDAAEVYNEELGAECVSGLTSRLQDMEETKELFGYLAQCASSEVRIDIAYMDNLNEETVELLSRDASIDIRRRLCGATPFREWASTELLIEYIKADIDCAKTIAGGLGDYNDADPNKVAIELCKHSDPDVRNALAGSWGTPKKLLKQLLSDPDASVRASAKRTLR